ncbi:hypothetical protein GCM10023191_034270 [Actinoallomurus oryzae]|uniref:Uncharacterized protein n=1 Tax=Actinoallomurus oryzae TaxID=502180 RepID=A0ABP8PZC7_9ACTN
MRDGFTPRDYVGPRLPLHWGCSRIRRSVCHLPGGGKSQPDYGAMYLKCRENGNAFGAESMERTTYPL